MIRFILTAASGSTLPIFGAAIGGGLAASGGTNASLAVSAPDSGLPQTPSQYWDLGIGALTPMIVLGIRKIVPNIPTWALPAITPIIGILLGLALHYLDLAHLSFYDAAKAGMLAVFIRETFNQAVTQRLSPKPPSPALPPPKP
jgi:hypothetical protein